MKLLKSFLAALISLSAFSLLSAAEEKKPNILWIYVEDLSPWMGCYDSKINAGKTPVMDELAKKGTRFSRCYMPAPVCSVTRSALITGAMQTTSRTHNHRSSRSPEAFIHLPKGWKTMPQLMAENGYATMNRGKDDYNFHYKRTEHYTHGNPDNQKLGYGQRGVGKLADLPKDKPFFVQIQLAGGKSRMKNFKDRVDPSTVNVPGYFPNTDVFKKWWAHHYSTVRATDLDVKRVLAELKATGRAENTIVFFFSDHGNNHSVRHKQFCYEGGVHVPLIITGKGIGEGKVSTDLVSGIDISATTLALAGVEKPQWFEGNDLFAKDYKKREHVISARDRCDYTIDVTRTVRTDKFRYLRNYKTDRIYLQPQYRDGSQYVKELHKLHKEGKLSKYQDAFYFGKRPEHELYDLENDPHELKNLAADPKYAAELKRHIAILEKWQKETGDKGMQPEPEVELNAILKRWKKRCVNPEFDALKKKAAK